LKSATAGMAGNDGFISASPDYIMAIKGIIFDLDGTLVSTRPEYRYIVTGSALSELGVSRGRQDIDRFWFGPDRDATVRSWGVDASRFWKAFRKYDTTELRKKHACPFQDVRVLDSIRRMGIKAGIVTGSPEHIASLEIGMLNFDFDAIVIANDSQGIRQKPHPQGILECMRMMGLGRDDILFVGNGEEDVEASRRAGVGMVLIDRGENKIDCFGGSRISGLEELMEMIKRR